MAVDADCEDAAVREQGCQHVADGGNYSLAVVDSNCFRCSCPQLASNERHFCGLRTPSPACDAGFDVGDDDDGEVAVLLDVADSGFHCNHCWNADSLDKQLY